MNSKLFITVAPSIFLLGCDGGGGGDTAVMDQPWGHWDRGNHFQPVAPGPGADNPRAVGAAGIVHATLGLATVRELAYEQSALCGHCASKS